MTFTARRIDDDARIQVIDSFLMRDNHNDFIIYDRARKTACAPKMIQLRSRLRQPKKTSHAYTTCVWLPMDRKSDSNAGFRLYIVIQTLRREFYQDCDLIFSTHGVVVVILIKTAGIVHCRAIITYMRLEPRLRLRCLYCRNRARLGTARHRSDLKTHTSSNATKIGLANE